MARYAVGTEVRVSIIRGDRLGTGCRGMVEKLGHGFVTVRDSLNRRYRYPLAKVVLEKLSASCHATNISNRPW